jgi:ATP-dependent helicase/nuclease subunit B
VQATFLLGPAGSGKTWRCLADIRAALHASPDGPPLLLLAPKQATFQLERQLLAAGSLAGYTRLRIVSFERLAGFVLDALGTPAPALLSDDGRVMVLRALLAREAGNLRGFRAAARLTGFAQQLSLVLRELQHHQLSPDRLDELARRLAGAQRLNDKLHDLALLLRAYRAWLAEHQLQDANRLLDLAAEALRGHSAGAPVSSAPALHVAGLWLDGFAEMTPQELALLAALAPRCDRATLAFCLGSETEDGRRWLSTWSVTGRTFSELRARLSGLPGVTTVVETLVCDKTASRFAGQPGLQHLAQNWANPVPFAGGSGLLPGALRLVGCANPEAEAVFAAREILRFVRDEGGRFRQVAVLVRSLDAYHDALRRVFTRYDIPFFLDRREAVGHHPLAELTRHALRTVAFDWQPDDWFGALKTGLVDDDEATIDLLENTALAKGWKGAAWRKPLPLADESDLADRLERLRRRVIAPFTDLAAALDATGRQPTGTQLAGALRALWQALDVEDQLTAWSNAGISNLESRSSNRVHATVWEQMNALLDSLALAFPREPLRLADWLPILEAGLANLTVGVIPPALDQVLIGAVDRSRNPDLRCTLLLGLNDGVFPAPPAPAAILTRADRETLADAGVELDPDPHRQLGRERYYGYVACTRASQRLIATFSARDADDRPLNPSPLAGHLQRLFPTLQVETALALPDLSAIEHGSELIAPLLLRDAALRIELPPALAAVVEALRRRPGPDAAEALSPALAERLYGPVLKTSVSRLEQFAACPFRFFVHSGLRAEERERFEVDARQRGSFQHELLKRFDDSLRAEGRRWRELTPAEARARIGRIGAAVAREFGEGLFQADDRNLFTARSLTAALQDFIEVVVGWMRGGYEFDPAAVELDFGGKAAALPAWEIDLGGGHRLMFRGKIDRVDLATAATPGAAFCVVVDYKSSQRKMDPVLLANGVQIQLPAYLAALRRIAAPGGPLGDLTLLPAGMFYVSLRGQYPRGRSRWDAQAEAGKSRLKAYQHRGRFSLAALPKLDARRSGAPSGQFAYRLKKNGEPYASDSDPLPAGRLDALLDDVEAQLRRMGGEIFAGVARVDPYRHGTSHCACDGCEDRAICRIDPWIHEFRRLREVDT